MIPRQIRIEDYIEEDTKTTTSQSKTHTKQSEFLYNYNNITKEYKDERER